MMHPIHVLEAILSPYFVLASHDWKTIDHNTQTCAVIHFSYVCMSVWLLYFVPSFRCAIVSLACSLTSRHETTGWENDWIPGASETLCMWSVYTAVFDSRFTCDTQAAKRRREWNVREPLGGTSKSGMSGRREEKKRFYKGVKRGFRQKSEKSGYTDALSNFFMMLFSDVPWKRVCDIICLSSSSLPSFILLFRTRDVLVKRETMRGEDVWVKMQQTWDERQSSSPMIICGCLFPHILTSLCMRFFLGRKNLSSRLSLDSSHTGRMRGWSDACKCLETRVSHPSISGSINRIPIPSSAFLFYCY